MDRPFVRTSSYLSSCDEVEHQETRWQAVTGRAFKESQWQIGSKSVKYFANCVLSYDTYGILGLGAWRAAATRASQVAKKRVIAAVFWTIVFFFVFFFLTYFTNKVGKELDISKIQDLARDFHNLCNFLMGFFVSTCFSRWWAIRNDCIGGLWGACNDLMMLVSATFPTDSQADREIRERVLRWTVLSHELLYMQVREDLSLDDLVSKGFVKEEERAILERLPSRPQVVWAWMCSFFAHLAYGDPALGGSRLPFPMTILPQIYEICRKGRGAIGMAFAYTDTQVPFRYVHFLALLIWVHNFVQALTSATVINHYLLHENSMRCVLWETAFLLLYPVIYFGLLHLGAGMLNPLRAKHDIDFPRGAFSYFMMAEMRAFCRANKQPPYGPAPTWCSQAGTSTVQVSSSLTAQASEAGTDWVLKLESLCKLRTDGMLSEDEFKAAKQKLLSNHGKVLE